VALLLLATACAPPAVDWSPLPDFDPDDLDAPHRDPRTGQFFNPWDPQEHRMSVLFRWAVSRNEEVPVETQEVPRLDNRGAHLAGFANGPEITWVGHSTFAIHDGARVALTDPHFGPRALVAPRKTPPGLPVEAIPHDAFAVISHNHYDHLDAFSVDALGPGVRWFVPLGLKDWFDDRDRVATELDWWESAEHGGWRLTCLPSQHWSRRIGQRPNQTLWCAWLLESPSHHRYFFAGDTGYFGGFREFGRRLPEIDVALLPIGAYAPRWIMGYQHLTPAEAYRAFLDLGARFFLAMHWGTFDLTDEALDAAPRRLAEALPAGERRVRVLAVGETWEIPELADNEGEKIHQPIR
jgi:N-acyl-phosphatidylethanolamine-hydrolysing phospholipase D